MDLRVVREEAVKFEVEMIGSGSMAISDQMLNNCQVLNLFVANWTR